MPNLVHAEGGKLVHDVAIAQEMYISEISALPQLKFICSISRHEV